MARQPEEKQDIWRDGKCGTEPPNKQAVNCPKTDLASCRKAPAAKEHQSACSSIRLSLGQTEEATEIGAFRTYVRAYQALVYLGELRYGKC